MVAEPERGNDTGHGERRHHRVADSHGWSLEGITIRELVPSESALHPEEQYTMFHPADVELSETTKTILADVERVKPARVVFDSMSELRLLAGNPLRYRRQILALKQFFAGRQCTVMLLDDLTSTDRDLQVQSIAHGVVLLDATANEFSAHPNTPAYLDDVIGVGDTTYGWVETMGARYTSVVSRDGREYLIPNEDFVTQRVINWSYSNDRVRLDVKFGVSYASDPHVVRALAAEAVADIPRVLKTPEPSCHLVRFGESSLDFLLRFWIRDPVEGLASVRSAVMLALWDVFKREGIEFPYPVRDLHMDKPVRVVMERGAD
jgi:hypothetical protein